MTISPQTWIATILGASGVLISLSVLYLSHLRGPSMKVQLLDLPIEWSMQYWKGRGSVKYSSTLDEAAYCQVAGVAYMLITNDGPRGGAVWGLTVTSPGLPSWCTVQPPADLEATITLAGYETAGSQMTIALVWPVDRVEEMLTKLADPLGGLTLRVAYKRHTWKGPQRETSDLKIQYRSVWDRLNNGRIGLADLAVVGEVDRQLTAAFKPFELGDGDVDALRAAMWWPIRNPDQPLDYPIDEFQGVPRLRFRNDLMWSVSGKFSADELAQIRNAHRNLVEGIAQKRAERAQALQIAEAPKG